MKARFRKFVNGVLGLPRYVLVLVGALLLFYLVFMNHIEPDEVGIARNVISGQMWLQKAGWHLTAPWTFVARIGINPMRVGVPTAGRGFSSKLVQFNPEAWREFVANEGFRYYWWANRLSFNFGHKEEYRGAINILRPYAYSAKRYPFITVLEEYQAH